MARGRTPMPNTRSLTAGGSLLLLRQQGAAAFLLLALILAHACSEADPPAPSLGTDAAAPTATAPFRASASPAPHWTASAAGLTVAARVHADPPESGEAVTFTFMVENPTEADYTDLELDTGVDRQLLHFIRNVGGATNIRTDGDTIRVEHIRIEPRTTISVTFTATLNFSAVDYALYASPVLLRGGGVVVAAGATENLNVSGYIPQILQEGSQ